MGRKDRGKMEETEKQEALQAYKAYMEHSESSSLLLPGFLKVLWGHGNQALSPRCRLRAEPVRAWTKWDTYTEVILSSEATDNTPATQHTQCIMGIRPFRHSFRQSRISQLPVRSSRMCGSIIDIANPFKNNWSETQHTRDRNYANVAQKQP